MALWLDLIPKIHRSDNLDERFHLLDNFQDVGSFDADGVDLSRLDQLRRTYATSTTMSPTNSSTTVPRVGNAVAHTEPLPSRSSHLSSRPRSTATARPVNSRTTSRSAATDLIRSLFSRSRDGSMPLGVTIAVGSGLLFLNVLVFVAIFYQREKATRDVREWRRRRRTETGSSAGDDDDEFPADKYFDETQDSCSETARSGGAGGGGAGDTDSNSSLSVALCPSKIGTTTGDDNDAHLYRTHLQQSASHHQQRTDVHNDVHLTTLPQSSAGCDAVYDTVRRGCCRRSSPCRLDMMPVGERRTILKDCGRRQQSHSVQSPPPPPPPTSQSPAAVAVVVTNHSHPLQCYDDNPSTTV